MNNKAIGIFDSGLGGLTVLKEINKILPHEDLIYFGDTAHVPYGNKSAQTVTKYSLAIAKFLEKQKVKLIVVACNTASALSLEELQKHSKVPVIGVINAGAKAAVSISGTKQIAVLATESTVNSGQYKHEIVKLNKKSKVTQIPCPLFVPIVEEGLWNTDIAVLAAKRYLKLLNKSKTDTVILGCTHYPLLEETIGKIAGKKVNIVDSAAAVAREVKEILDEKQWNKKGGKPKMRFISSDSSERFKKLARTILGLNVKTVEQKTFFQ